MRGRNLGGYIKAMTKKTKFTFTLSIILALAMGIGIGGYAATSYGTESDPLVTLSYLTDTLSPEVMEALEEQLDLSETEIAAKFVELVAAQDGMVSDTYHVVSLGSGQTLKGSAGCEIMLRIGSVTASGSSEPALIDTTTGSSVSAGTSLEENHLYLVTIADNGVKATSSGTKILVRGEYSIGY